MDVVVHPNVDLDAIACIVARGIGIRVHYIPAGAKELPAVCPCHKESLSPAAHVLDHALGEKGRLDADGTRHAAALSMPETCTWDPRLLAEIDEHDSTGKVDQPRFSLSYILMAVKAYIAHLHELARPGEEVPTMSIDEGALMAMRPIIEGLNIIHRRLIEARSRAAKIPVVAVGNFRVAIPEAGDPPFQVAEVLNKEYGCTLQIYHDGNNLGVFRYPGHTEPDLRRLAKALGVPQDCIGKNETQDKKPVWFIHTAGFLACWGSKKSPAISPPPQGTPQSVEEVIEIVRRAFGP